MKTINVKLKIDQQKFDAAQQFMEEKELDINTELSKAVEDFYKKFVPTAVRKYIEKSTATPHSHTVNSPPTAPNESSESGSKEPNSDQEHHVFDSTGSYGV